VPGLLLPKGSVPLCLQHYCTTLLEPTPGKQAPEFLLYEVLVSLCLQQLPWLQVAQHQQASLRSHTTCGLGSLAPAVAAVAPGSPCTNASRPQDYHCLVGTRQFKPTSSAASWVPPLATQGQKPATTHPCELQAPGFVTFWHQEASFPTEHRGPALPTVPDTPKRKHKSCIK
jgi:hypothetical protein